MTLGDFNVVFLEIWKMEIHFGPINIETFDESMSVNY